MSSERGGKVFASEAVPEGAKSFPEEPLDTEWRHAKLRRMQRQPGRRPVLLVLGPRGLERPKERVRRRRSGRGLGCAAALSGGLHLSAARCSATLSQ